ncbi:hypothetical protein [Methylobacterium indicum]|uniref:Uncharacterized protein n=1 Tax=Methylobacterium indicum TaxID=1775910 RepID=A0ABR5HEY6_9HYPH|nr:hypothetical protein [Methylobacterium indicum]KMO18897.1 hypothetical protein QR78_14400 [Methylobacterium indicum]KMO25055.1 hypothetical protein QR79_09790 [Methylobacterium indicum]
MKKHPSGRPLHRVESRDYSMRVDRWIGHRTPRLNPQHIPNATDLHAVGFVDWGIRAAQAEFMGPAGRKRQP